MPQYDLATVKALVHNQRNIIMLGNSRRDRINLGYEMSDVQACINMLQEDGFHRTHEYGDHTVDSYKISYLLSGQEMADNLYIKFYIDREQQIVVKVLSFHMDR
ncbi:MULTISPECIES: type II toxin-antitoxin system MqsR family toxin [Shewanella]|uniref:type II toxin-antitoxin system MqsR family toxin n=1 Tax=Shewanella TaxID=22 RepID=UPI0037471A7B